MINKDLILELKDFYNMIQGNLPIKVKWKSIKSRRFIGFKTVWKRCDEIQPMDDTVIGEYRPSAFTILQLINELKGDWYFTHDFVAEYVEECQDKYKAIRALTSIEPKNILPYQLYMDGSCYAYAKKENLKKDFLTLKLVFPNFEGHLDI